MFLQQFVTKIIFLFIQKMSYILVKKKNLDPNPDPDPEPDPD